MSFVLPSRLPQAILFDWDNTLVDTWKTTFDGINSTLARMDKPLMTIDDFWATPHLSLRDSFPEMFGHHWQEAEKHFYEHVLETHIENLDIHDGAHDLLELIFSKGIYMGVVSNKNGPLLRREVSHIGWDPHFGKVVGARDTAEDKPSPLPVKAALENTGIFHGPEVWFVGDSIVDVRCAKATGCIPIVVGHDEASREDNIVHLGDCKMLAKFIENM
ncbi:HAD family hydrolase [Candidatus Bealeia paramacronuclearis]|uniref:phosphoglycolate phosphatase n=1 Tax=Candidatus Bealeia paramacronuclearis TaxID=1921001 RepID=A0ABZ2C2V7_9PROT|nr:HAD family hydrolase [Candidatus Bealeia paramacronuclearis]